MLVFCDSGRIGFAEAVALRPMHVAWGTGDGLWTVPPAGNASATELLNEIGRRQVSEVGFVNPDAGGDIVLANGTFAASLVPTRHLYVRCDFDYTDAASSVIREVGLVVGSVMVGGLPGTQRYFTETNIANAGRLMAFQNIAPIARSTGSREHFEFVISF